MRKSLYYFLFIIYYAEFQGETRFWSGILFVAFNTVVIGH